MKKWVILNIGLFAFTVFVALGSVVIAKFYLSPQLLKAEANEIACTPNWIQTANIEELRRQVTLQSHYYSQITKSANAVFSSGVEVFVSFASLVAFFQFLSLLALLRALKDDPSTLPRWLRWL